MLYSLLTALPQTTESIKLDITWTITAIIAVSSFLSPIFVAIINNRHHSKIRKLELTHDEQLRKIDLQQQNVIHQFDVYYADKKKAFLDFLQAAGDFSGDRTFLDTYTKIQAMAQTVLLFCDARTKQKLLEFLALSDSAQNDNFTFAKRQEYTKALSEIVAVMNQDLESSKPRIDCE